MAKGLSDSTNNILEKLKKGYKSENTSPASSNGVAERPEYNASDYTSMAADVLDSYLNRKDFSYDVNTDKFYSQYTDEYKKAGKNAMRDTVSKASELTGGYANSYAVNAGNQAYSSYLDKLNDILPELENQAYERYTDETKTAKEKIDMLLDLDSSEYNKYRDALQDYFTDREFYEDNYRYRENADMEMYKALSDYILELAGLENSDYYKDMDLALAYDKLAYDKDKEANDLAVAMAELAAKEKQDKQTLDYNRAKLAWEKEKDAMNRKDAQKKLEYELK